MKIKRSTTTKQTAAVRCALTAAAVLAGMAGMGAFTGPVTDGAQHPQETSVRSASYSPNDFIWPIAPRPVGPNRQDV